MELSPGDTTAIIPTPPTSMTRVREIFTYVPTEAENAVALTHTDLQQEAGLQLLLAVTRWGPMQPYLKDM